MLVVSAKLRVIDCRRASEVMSVTIGYYRSLSVTIGYYRLLSVTIGYYQVRVIDCRRASEVKAGRLKGALSLNLEAVGVAAAAPAKLAAALQVLRRGYYRLLSVTIAAGLAPHQRLLSVTIGYYRCRSCAALEVTIGYYRLLSVTIGY